MSQSIMINKPKTNTRKIKTYNVDFIYSLYDRVNRNLPEKTMKALNMSTKIRSVMNKEDIQNFNKKLDTFDAPALKKKINSLLNKLAAVNIDGIFQKVNQILQNRKVLIEYTIKQLMTYALALPMLVDTYAKFFKKLHTPKTEKIFQSTFKELLSVLNGKANSNINSAVEYKKFLDYLEDKSKYTTLYLFLASLNKLKIVKDTQIVDQIKELEETIMKSTVSQNDKYAECYVKLITKIGNKKYVHLKEIKAIIGAKVVSMRIKFALYDIQDLHKCDFCKKNSCRTCSNLKKASKN